MKRIIYKMCIEIKKYNKIKNIFVRLNICVSKNIY